MSEATIQGRYSKQWLSRYYQLLSLIRLHKPRSIVEVGTFDAKRAVGMLEEALRHHSNGGITYTGYDLFENATEETDAQEFNVRAHPTEELARHRLQVFCDRYGNRVQFRTISGNTRQTLTPQSADFTFIDGGHSVGTIQSDYDRLKGSKVVVLDDYYENDSSGAGPDTNKVGCNSLVSQLTEVHILPTHNPVEGGGRVKMAVKFGADTLCGVRLRPDGPLMPYVFHKYNCGHPASLRRTERTVELAVGFHWIQAVMDHPDEYHLIEIGAVTPYYLRKPGITMPVVVDPADGRATVKDSLFNVDLRGQDVLSLSTIEHVGNVQYGLTEAGQTPLTAFQFILRSAKRFLISFPYGWPHAKLLQRFVIDNRDSLANDGVTMYPVSRQSDETWAVSNDLYPYGNKKRPWANTVIFLEKGGLI